VRPAIAYGAGSNEKFNAHQKGTYHGIVPS
jgi:hypothetical protein